jgi:hypothetical protein
MMRRTTFSLAAAALALAGGLSLAQPARAEIPVNTTESGQQINPDVAVNPVDGSFVVVWQSDAAGEYDIYMQRYDNLGNPLGSETQVNVDEELGRQSRPSIAMDATGDFVVAFESQNTIIDIELEFNPQAIGDDDDFDIYAQRFNADGTPQGMNFLVNTTTDEDQSAPDVAMDNAGNFVIAYEDTSTGGYNILARPYTATGAGGTEIPLNTDAGDQQLPRISINDAGTQGVLVYRDSAQDGSGFGIAGQLFTANLATPSIATSGTEFQVNNVTTLGDQDEPAVDMDGNGNFVVAWQTGAEGSRNIAARTYTIGGTPLTNEFNADGSGGDQFGVDVALADSNPGTLFTLTYAGDQSGSNEIYAKTYDFATLASAGAFVVNTTIAGSQFNPAIDATDEGAYVIAWQGPDDEANGIYAERLLPNGSTVPVGEPLAINDPPVADAGPDQTVPSTGFSTEVIIDASGSTDPEGDTLTYTFESSDGQIVGPQSGNTASFFFAPGTYTVTVTVSDGEFSDSDTAIITVTPPPSTPNSSINAAGYIVPNVIDDIRTNSVKSVNRGKVELSFWGANDRNGLGGGIWLKDPRFGGYEFKSTRITSLVVSGNVGTLYGIGKSVSPAGRFENVGFIATGFDIFSIFLGRGDRVQIQTADGYTLQGYYDRGDVRVIGGSSPTPTPLPTLVPSAKLR